MRSILAGWIVLMAFATASAKEVYEGTWVTTNRRLDGTMTCVVTNLGGNQWHGHFYGVWQDVPFSYKVDFSGPPAKLRGTAVIDGARYEWTGEFSQGVFRGSFGGDRYFGSFVLKRKES